MTKNKILSLILFSLIFSSIKAQDNNIKLNLMSIPLGIIHPQYERVLTPRLSIQLGLGVSPNKKVPQFSKDLLQDFVQGQSDDDNSEESIISLFNDLRYNTLLLTPEVRYYLSGKKGAPKGIYLGAFLRYSRHSGTSIYPHNRDSSGEIVDFDGIIKSTSFGGGINLGVQWIVKEKLSIDWTFIGLGLNKSTIDLLIESENMTPDDISEIKGEINDTYTGGDIFNVKVSSGNDSVRAVYTGLLPILRFGLSLGYAF